MWQLIPVPKTIWGWLSNPFLVILEDCLLFFRTSMSNVLVRFAPSELLGGSAEVKGTSCRIGPDGKAMEFWS